MACCMVRVPAERVGVLGDGVAGVRSWLETVCAGPVAGKAGARSRSEEEPSSQ
jgi:hypothetical protein